MPMRYIPESSSSFPNCNRSWLLYEILQNSLNMDLDTELRSDRRKPTDPARRALDGAVKETKPRIPAMRSDSSWLSSTDSQRRTSKGASSTTTQIQQLNSPRVASFPTDDATASLMEGGRFGETANVATLPPADEGFGAWSYTASAFLMFVVVWGRLFFSMV